MPVDVAASIINLYYEHVRQSVMKGKHINFSLPQLGFLYVSRPKIKNKLTYLRKEVSREKNARKRNFISLNIEFLESLLERYGQEDKRKQFIYEKRIAYLEKKYGKKSN